MPKYVGNEQDITGEVPKKEGIKLDNLDKINKAMETGLSIVDKIVGLAKYRQEQGGSTMPPAQQTQVKAEKMLSQQAPVKQTLVIDESLAVDKLLELGKNIPEEIRKQPLEAVLEGLEDKKEFIKPQVQTFIKSCVRLE